jgi:hypothetical protein
MITRETKTSEIVEKYPQILEVFVKISPRFKKLKNKILRKALASRVNVEQAASIAGVDPNFLLIELNKSINSPNTDKTIKIENSNVQQIENEKVNEKPIEFSKEKIIELDVRPILLGAIFIYHIKQGLLTSSQSLEISVLVLFLLVIFFLFGSGEISIDNHKTKL